MNKIGHVKNPLTVVAIFAGLTEVSGTAILPLIAAKNQANYMWFLMIFPILLVVIFFWTLNNNHQVLYAPSDYRDDQSFLEAMRIIEELKPILAKEEEPGDPTGDSESMSLIASSLPSDLDPVIRALGGAYTWRTMRGIAREIDQSLESVSKIMSSLASEGLVVNSRDNNRWALTVPGRNALATLLPTPATATRPS